MTSRVASGTPAIVTAAYVRQTSSGARTRRRESIAPALAGIPQGRDLSRFDAVWKEPVLYQAILRWRTLGWFSESEITRLVTDHYTAGMFSWLLHHNQAMEELLVTLHPKNDCGKVLKFLMDVWPLNEKNYEKFFSLAVACAVVFELDYLVTWNCAHIANANSAKRIAMYNAEHNRFMPMIVTPDWFEVEP